MLRSFLIPEPDDQVEMIEPAPVRLPPAIVQPILDEEFKVNLNYDLPAKLRVVYCHNPWPGSGNSQWIRSLVYSLGHGLPINEAIRWFGGSPLLGYVLPDINTMFVDVNSLRSQSESNEIGMISSQVSLELMAISMASVLAISINLNEVDAEDAAADESSVVLLMRNIILKLAFLLMSREQLLDTSLCKLPLTDILIEFRTSQPSRVLPFMKLKQWRSSKFPAELRYGFSEADHAACNKELLDAWNILCADANSVEVLVSQNNSDGLLAQVQRTPVHVTEMPMLLHGKPSEPIPIDVGADAVSEMCRLCNECIAWFDSDARKVSVLEEMERLFENVDFSTQAHFAKAVMDAQYYLHLRKHTLVLEPLGSVDCQLLHAIVAQLVGQGIQSSVDALCKLLSKRAAANPRFAASALRGLLARPFWEQKCVLAELAVEMELDISVIDMMSTKVLYHVENGMSDNNTVVMIGHDLLRNKFISLRDNLSTIGAEVLVLERDQTLLSIPNGSFLLEQISFEIMTALAAKLGASFNLLSGWYNCWEAIRSDQDVQSNLYKVESAVIQQRSQETNGDHNDATKARLERVLEHYQSFLDSLPSNHSIGNHMKAVAEEINAMNEDEKEKAGLRPLMTLFKELMLAGCRSIDGFGYKARTVSLECACLGLQMFNVTDEKEKKSCLAMGEMWCVLCVYDQGASYLDVIAEQYNSKGASLNEHALSEPDMWRLLSMLIKGGMAHEVAVRGFFRHLFDSDMKEISRSAMLSMLLNVLHTVDEDKQSKGLSMVLREHALLQAVACAKLAMAGNHEVLNARLKDAKKYAVERVALERNQQMAEAVMEDEEAEKAKEEEDARKEVVRVYQNTLLQHLRNEVAYLVMDDALPTLASTPFVSSNDLHAQWPATRVLHMLHHAFCFLPGNEVIGQIVKDRALAINIMDYLRQPVCDSEGWIHAAEIASRLIYHEHHLELGDFHRSLMPEWPAGKNWLGFVRCFFLRNGLVGHVAAVLDQSEDDRVLSKALRLLNNLLVNVERDSAKQHELELMLSGLGKIWPLLEKVHRLTLDQFRAVKQAGQQKAGTADRSSYFTAMYACEVLNKLLFSLQEFEDLVTAAVIANSVKPVILALHKERDVFRLQWEGDADAHMFSGAVVHLFHSVATVLHEEDGRLAYVLPEKHATLQELDKPTRCVSEKKALLSCTANDIILRWVAHSYCGEKVLSSHTQTMLKMIAIAETYDKDVAKANVEAKELALRRKKLMDDEQQRLRRIELDKVAKEQREKLFSPQKGQSPAPVNSSTPLCAPDKELIRWVKTLQTSGQQIVDGDERKKWLKSIKNLHAILKNIGPNKNRFRDKIEIFPFRFSWLCGFCKFLGFEVAEDGYFVYALEGIAEIKTRRLEKCKEELRKLLLSCSST